MSKKEWTPPKMTTSQRDALVILDGMIRGDETGPLDIYKNGKWVPIPAPPEGES